MTSPEDTFGTPEHRIKDTLATLANTVDLIDATKGQHDELVARRDAYIRECAAAGASYRKIAESAGINHQRVAQIINGRSDR